MSSALGYRARRAWESALALACVVLVCHCGAARPQGPASATPSPSPATNEETPSAPAVEAAPAPEGVPAQAAGAPPEAPAPPASSWQSTGGKDRQALRMAARVDFDRAQRELDLAMSSCESACRALAAMERATAHLCSLADQTDDQRRCDDARQRLAASRARVRAACGACP